MYLQPFFKWFWQQTPNRNVESSNHSNNFQVDMSKTFATATLFASSLAYQWAQIQSDYTTSGDPSPLAHQWRANWPTSGPRSEPTGPKPARIRAGPLVGSDASPLAGLRSAPTGPPVVSDASPLPHQWTQMEWPTSGLRSEPTGPPVSANWLTSPNSQLRSELAHQCAQM